MGTGVYEDIVKTAPNLGNVNFQPGQVLVIDLVNSSGQIRGAALPTAAKQNPLGVCTDKVRLSSIDGTVESGQSVSYVDHGSAWCIAHSAINIGDKVAIAATDGSVATVAALSGAGSTAVPIVGTAETAATALGQGVIVRLEIGSEF